MTERTGQPERCLACGHEHDEDGEARELFSDCCDYRGSRGSYCDCTDDKRTIAALRATVEQQAREIERLKDRETELQAANTREVMARREAHNDYNSTAHELAMTWLRQSADAALGANLRKLVAEEERQSNLVERYAPVIVLSIEGWRMTPERLDAALAAAAAALAEEPGE